MSKQKDPEHTETGDQCAVKNLLDDTVKDVVSDSSRFNVDYKADNFKLFLLTISCVIAAIAHFFKDYRYITESTITLGCIASFFFLQGVLVCMSYWTGDTLIECYTKNGEGPIWIRTSFPIGEDHYCVVIQDRKRQRKAKQKLYVGDFFDYEGYFDQKGFESAFRSILNSFDKKEIKKTK
uniref:Signal peptidase complex subunit 2 n=1 Tax=Albugo laibachii Nc14 TaxID=890382 RepID=F0W6L5_9STRA|nr:AlNc14C25G2504 [Albugo laibachii Nc14]|eukprot:CCA16760.1 AlNc14C25G2504 [Albugo laibachii Nc14]